MAADRLAPCHYSDVIMRIIWSQITGDSSIWSTVCLDVHQRKHQSSVSLLLCEGNRPVTGRFPSPSGGFPSPREQRPVTRKIFHFVTSSYVYRSSTFMALIIQDKRIYIYPHHFSVTICGRSKINSSSQVLIVAIHFIHRSVLSITPTTAKKQRILPTFCWRNSIALV